MDPGALELGAATLDHVDQAMDSRSAISRNGCGAGGLGANLPGKGADVFNGSLSPGVVVPALPVGLAHGRRVDEPIRVPTLNGDAIPGAGGDAGSFHGDNSENCPTAASKVFSA
jgi:hypothetical protein